jgi:threonine/homoserine/homoserine lactone efflux protein
MILLYFIIGIVAAIIGAIPPGATNIAVINTTIRRNSRQAFKITLAAGFAEVVLSYYALHCNMTVKDFFDTNQWLQIFIAILLLAIGSILFFKKTKKHSEKNHLKSSKYLTGFLLGMLNPPVLIYWLVIYSVINNYALNLTINSPLSTLFLFFFGVYSGKLITLFVYSKFSQFIKNRFDNITLIINKVTGSLLFFVGLLNVIKIYFL